MANLLNFYKFNIHKDLKRMNGLYQWKQSESNIYTKNGKSISSLNTKQKKKKSSNEIHSMDGRLIFLM